MLICLRSVDLIVLSMRLFANQALHVQFLPPPSSPQQLRTPIRLHAPRHEISILIILQVCIVSLLHVVTRWTHRKIVWTETLNIADDCDTVISTHAQSVEYMITWYVSIHCCAWNKCS